MGSMSSVAAAKRGAPSLSISSLPPGEELLGEAHAAHPLGCHCRRSLMADEPERRAAQLLGFPRRSLLLLSLTSSIASSLCGPASSRNLAPWATWSRRESLLAGEQLRRPGLLPPVMSLVYLWLHGVDV